MLARMRWIGAAAGMAIVLISGCQATKDGEAKPQAQAPGQLPSFNALEVGEAQPKPILSNTHYTAGRLHESQGHLERAVEQYRLALQMEPNHLEAMNRLGITLGQLGRLKEAETIFQQAITQAPDKAYLRNNLAFSYIMEKRWADAEAQLREALRLQGDFARAHINLGMALAQQGRFDESLNAFRQILPADESYYNLGLMYQSKRMNVEAARAFKTALEWNTNLTAAKKRLDAMPANVISAADQAGVMSASPTPTTLPAVEQTVQTERPTTQPAETANPQAEWGTQTADATLPSEQTQIMESPAPAPEPEATPTAAPPPADESIIGDEPEVEAAESAIEPTESEDDENQPNPMTVGDIWPMPLTYTR